MFLLQGTGYTVCAPTEGVSGAVVKLNRSACGEPVQQVWVYLTDGSFTDPLQQEVVLVPLNGVGNEVGDPSRPTPLFNVRQAILLAML